MFCALRGWEQRDLEKRAADITARRVEKLQSDIWHSMEVLHSIAALHAVGGDLCAKDFHAFVQRALVRQHEIQALSWNPLVRADDRSTFERRAIGEGQANYEFREFLHSGELVRAGDRPEYVPVRFIEPNDGNSAALGYDLNSDPSRRVAIEQARDSGQAVATQPVRLAQSADSEAGFLVLLPVYNTEGIPKTVQERREELAGFAVAVFRVKELVGTTFDKLRNLGIGIAVFDEAIANKPLYDNRSELKASSARSPARTVWLEIANRRWAVRYILGDSFISAQSRAQSWLGLSAGLAFTALTAAYFWHAGKRTRQIADANTALKEEISIRKKAEALAEAANASKSDFLARMSHEIRTPLNAMLGYTQLLHRDRSLSPEQRDSVGCITTSGQHLLGLINEILDLSKIEAGKMDLNPADFDLVGLARSLAATFQPLCAESRVGFRLVLNHLENPWVQGDEGKVRQVLINLLGNAVKFTRSGQVDLRISAGDSGTWLFEVIDTGLGIPEAEQARIFEPFHQGSNATRSGGTGLGLAIARKQVALLGGTLLLQSERGIGSRFYFEIPLPAAAPRCALPAGALAVARLKKGHHVRALVVDDRKENRDVLEKILRNIGCDVVVAAGGLEALAVAPAFKPDVAFVDLLMPELDGVATIKTMASEPAHRGIKIVAHSAAALHEYREAARAAGCVDFLGKPLNAEQVYNCLALHLGVEFDRSSEPLDEVTPATWMGPPVQIPGDLYAQLTTAAELHSTTALKRCQHQLRSLGAEGNRLGYHIRHLMRSYDMEGILRFIETAAVPSPDSRQSEHALASSEKPAP
jgi:signal transduction histidine kinase/ActR/RegA family two-component response regulator